MNQQVTSAPVGIRRRTTVVLWLLAVLAIGVGAAGASLASGGSEPSIPRNADAPTPPPRPTPLGAPQVQGADPASSLLTSWGRSYTGWVVVYGDGRVIFSNGGSGAKERRLSRRGLDLVRAGKLDLEQFLVTREVRKGGEVVISFAEGVSGVYRRQRLWAEPTARIYEPSKYAICPAVPPEVTDQLRSSQQNLLRGTEHTYHGTPMDNDPHPPSPPESPRECLEVTRKQIRALVEIFNDFQVDTGSIDIDSNGDPIQITFRSALPSGTGTDLFVGFFRPLLPHGDWVSFGG